MRPEAGVGRQATGGTSSFGCKARGRLVGLLGLTLALLAFTATPSLASITTRAPLTFSPITGAGSGVTIHGPSGVAVDETSGNVFLNDGNGGEVVDILGAEGGVPAGLVPPYTIGGFAFGGEPSGAAVDNSAASPNRGALYIVDVQHSEVKNYVRNTATEGYEAAGNLTPTAGSAFSEPLGAAVDSHGNVFVADYGSASVVKFGPTGLQLDRIDTSGTVGNPSSVALDSAGDLFVQGYGEGKVFKYTANGAGEIEPTVSTEILPAGATGIAIDMGANRLFVSLGDHVTEYDATTLTKGVEFGLLGSATRLAVNSVSGRVYVSDGGGPNVAVFGAVQTFADATAAPTAPTAGYFSADIGATIDDNNALPTGWRLELSSDDGVTWDALSSGQTAGSQAGVVVSATATGLSLNNDYKFRVVTNKGTGAMTAITSSAVAFKTLNVPAATATPTSATNLTAVSADIGAMIDDNSVLPTNWRIELSPDGGSTWSIVESGQTAGGQTGAAVSKSLTGLVPNTEYEFRTVTNKGSGSSDITSGSNFFSTPTAVPVVTNVGAVEVSDTSVRLVGTVDPRHAETSYFFQYGTTAALGSSTAPVAIGDGTSPLTVSQVVSGLRPGTTYHFKLVASNVAGPISSTDTTVATRTEPPPLLEHRAYEQVSPPEKGLTNIDDAALGATKFTVAEDGQAVGYCNASGAGAQVGTYCGDYIAQRTPDGWRSRVIAPRACGQDLTATEFTLGGQKGLALSKNLDYAAIAQPESASCAVDPLDPSAPLPANNLYRESLGAGTSTFDLLAPALAYSPGPRSFNKASGKYVGGSDDFGHLVYQSTGDQSADGVAVDGTIRLFEWDHGTVRLVSRDVANAPFNAPSSLGGNPDPMLGPRGNGYGGVSAGGDRIFFQSPVNNVTGDCETPDCELYLREDGAVTRWVSQQECNPACSDASAPDVFQWANRAGEEALFKTTAKLINDDTSPIGADLYMYRNSASPATEGNLILLSTDNEPTDGTEAEVKGVLGLGDDGNTVYFVAAGQLVAGGPTAAGPKVYRWRLNGGSPTVQYLATLDGGLDFYLWSYSGTANRRTLIRRVTRNGAHLLLDTVVQLDPVADQDATRDVYRWGEQGGWACLSCQRPGAPSAGESDIKALSRPFDPTPGAPPGLQDGQTQNSELVTVSNDDASRIFFASMDQLVAGDTNEVRDVYEWNGGRVSLISSGIGDAQSKLAGSSSSGNDVFFLTSDRLVGWDTDNFYDLYDARVGGGLPEPPSTGAGCGEGEPCREPGRGVPASTKAVTASFEGSSNAKMKHRCRKGFRKTKMHGRTACKKPRKHQKKHRRHSNGKGR